MSKPTKITLIFILIFVVGVLGFVASINRSLNKSSYPIPEASVDFSQED
jgi:hypothetical protein